jgi:hypothetical protein
MRFHFISIALVIVATSPPMASIAATDIPEEVLRAEIITEARSPIDGRPLSAGEFAELVTQVEARIDRDVSSTVADKPEFKDLVFLLRLRGFLKSVGIPIK